MLWKIIFAFHIFSFEALHETRVNICTTEYRSLSGHKSAQMMSVEWAKVVAAEEMISFLRTSVVLISEISRRMSGLWLKRIS